MDKGQASFVYSSSGNAVLVKGMLMVNLLGFLLSRAFVLEGAMPFGTAFFGAALLNRCMACQYSSRLRRALSAPWDL